MDKKGLKKGIKDIRKNKPQCSDCTKCGLRQVLKCYDQGVAVSDRQQGALLRR